MEEKPCQRKNNNKKWHKNEMDSVMQRNIFSLKSCVSCWVQFLCTLFVFVFVIFLKFPRKLKNNKGI